MTKVVPLDAADGATLFDDVHSFLGRFIAYPSPHTHVAHVLWIAHTHLMDVWESTPRCAFLSPEPGSGKTRAIEITETLVPRPVEAVNVSVAYLFRKVSDEGGLPTILYDEIDTVFGSNTKDNNEELRGLLNAGHRRGAMTGRCVTRGNNIECVDFPAYCAVALAGLGDLPDTILSRSVIVKMRRRAPDEAVSPYRRRVHGPAGNDLRERLTVWADGVRDSLTDAWPDLPDIITDRDADVWEPLVAVADAAGGQWPEIARVAAVTLVTQSREGGEGSLGLRLLSDLRLVFGSAEARATEWLLAELHKLDEAPWGDLRGKPMDSRGLAWRLRKYDIKPKVIRVNPTTTARGYTREDLHDTWQRYLPPPSPPKCVTPVTTETGGLDVEAEERAAIREFEGGMSREEAEAAEL